MFVRPITKIAMALGDPEYFALPFGFVIASIVYITGVVIGLSEMDPCCSGLGLMK